MAWYYGKMKKDGKVVYEIFSSLIRPTLRSHGAEYLGVTGPFASKKDAVSKAPSPAFVAREARKRKNMAAVALPTEEAFAAVREVRKSADLTPTEDENLWVAEKTLQKIHRKAFGV